MMNSLYLRRQFPVLHRLYLIHIGLQDLVGRLILCVSYRSEAYLISRISPFGIVYSVPNNL